MKKTATTMMLLAGFGGGCVSPDSQSAKMPAQPGGYGTVTRPQAIPGVQGPGGEPVAMMPVAARGAAPSGIQQAGYHQPQPKTLSGSMNVKQAGYKNAGESTTAHVPGGYSEMAAGPMPGPGYGPMPGGPMPGGPRGGILPVPGQGAPGAVAAFGAITGPGMGGPGGPAAPCNMRTSIRFTGPAGMKVTWQLPGGGFNDEANGLTAPKEYNFLQGQMYRLRLSQILPNFPGRVFYPTLEVSPASPKTMRFLAHSSVPLTFTNEDFDQVVAGNLVIKVIYLPDPTFQDFAVVAGAEEIVSTRLEPGADPVAEAQRRGTILAVITIGNIDLENRASPAMNAVPPGGPMGGPMMLPPGARPGAMPPGMANVNTPAAPTPSAPTPAAPGNLPGGITTPTTTIPTAPVAPLPVTPKVTAPTADAAPTLPVAPMPPLVPGTKDAKPATLPNIGGK